VTVIADPDQLTASGVALGVPLSTNDNCGVGSLANNASDPYPVGTNNVVWVAADVNGNSSSCTQRVIVAVFRIVSVTRENNDIRLIWRTAGGTTNQVQVTTGTDGGYSANYIDLSPLIIIPVTGAATTNYLDVDATTNAAERFYRVRLVP
jgi:hypothetical protein